MSEFIEWEEHTPGGREIKRQRVSDECDNPSHTYRMTRYAEQWMDGPGGSACRGEC